jgi:hypothetical protein
LNDNTSGSALDDDYSQARTLVWQGALLTQQYENSGVLAELEEGINTQSIANGFIPENHPMKPGCLNHLGHALRLRLEHLGEIADAGQAIVAQQQAVRLTPFGHLDKPGHISDLGNSFQSRFERLGDIADLDEAITAQQQAIRLTPDRHPDKPIYLNNLGASVQSRFEHKQSLRSDHSKTAGRPSQTVTLTSLCISTTLETPCKVGLSV